MHDLVSSSTHCVEESVWLTLRHSGRKATKRQRKAEGVDVESEDEGTDVESEDEGDHMLIRVN